MRGKIVTQTPSGTKSKSNTKTICGIREILITSRLILTYLIPCHLLTTHKLPTPAFLSKFPRLAGLFLPITTAIKRASLSGFDEALVTGEPYFVKRRIYLTLERARDIVLRNLLRKVLTAGGYEPLKEGQTEADRVKRTRIPIDEFVAAIRLSSGPASGAVLDRDEVECMLANMIYKVCRPLEMHAKHWRKHLLLPSLSTCRLPGLSETRLRPCNWPTLLMILLEHDERLHPSRARHGRPQ
jgi:hypothetical protein